MDSYPRMRPDMSRTSMSAEVCIYSFVFSHMHLLTFSCLGFVCFVLFNGCVYDYYGCVYLNSVWGLCCDWCVVILLRMDLYTECKK